MNLLEKSRVAERKNSWKHRDEDEVGREIRVGRSLDSNTMNNSDMEMEMETERETARESTMNHNESLRNLLTLARQLINEGRPSLALQALVAAVKSDGGDAAVFQTLQRARELYINKLQATSAADALASLFAECAIAEAQPLRSEESSSDTAGPSNVVTPDANGSSILAKSGRQQIVMDAFSDGSSFVCLQCGGLVSNHRKEEHETYWCCRT